MKTTPQKTNELFVEFPDVMTVHHVREALGIGRAGVYKLLEKQEIKNFRIGNTYKIPKSALIEYITEKCKNDQGGVK